MSKQLHDKLKSFPAYGTPQSLEGAIINALNFSDGCSADKFEQITYLKAHTRDYLAQKFATVLLEANDAEALMLKKLWEKITGETLCLTSERRLTSIDNTSEDLRKESRG